MLHYTMLHYTTLCGIHIRATSMKITTRSPTPSQTPDETQKHANTNTQPQPKQKNHCNAALRCSQQPAAQHDAKFC